MRTPPNTPPEVKQREDSGYKTEVRRYKVITPLFGGGVEPATADPVTTVRATEIRGQLRFWWRACRGGRYTTIDEMKDAEDLLWGAASTAKRPRPSKVAVAVTEIDAGKPLATVQTRDREVPVGDMRSPYGYGAFPLQDKPGAALREGVVFDLTITYPTDKTAAADVEAALWAWETFGGVGARTRRGFGALALQKIDGNPLELPRPEQLQASIQDKLRTHVLSGRPDRALPMLTQKPRMVILRQPGPPLAVLRVLLTKLKNFRQYRTGRFGRSYWPEPDAIRRRTRTSARHATPMSNVDKFPRAVFGLPIVFHFMDEALNDPPTTTLQGSKAERLASPLILKPVACAGDQAVGLAMILSTPLSPPGGLVLKGSTSPLPIRSDLTDDDARDINGLDGRTDVLQVFLDDIETL